ncbi:HAD hydrolase-like protein [Pseudomonas syringae group sp. J309-1]|uniref:HAD hydrolase-like protein n=1 Tax=Pseudomonas syringae group sp. J309-1 TaxID=3079588 RepID=UPI002910AE04|nr:HAD hydrolase-like protein [Pseudomonas syringae group sp. J309-1]MDU8358480.1 HAD hydrolase-like protein [Pseudomonas syringae group sp. J309-1]
MKILIFDLDGTLVDSAPGIVASLTHAVRALGHDFTPSAGITHLLGPPMTQVMAQLLVPYGDDRIDQGVELYRTHYGRYGISGSVAYPGIRQAIESLTSQGYALYVATSKRQEFAERILGDTALRGHFRSVFGTSPDGKLDNKSRLLDTMLAAEAICPRSACMIGDKRDDIVAAHQNGLLAIGDLWGYGTRTELIKCGADKLVEQPTDLLDVIVKA